MSVEPVDERRDRWLVQMTDIGSRLSRFLTHHCGLWIYEPETVNHNFPLNRLNWIHHHTYRSRIELLEALLRVNIGA